MAVQVEQAPEGRTHRELERLLRVRVRNTLLALVRQGRIGRERWQRSYLYVSAEPDRAGRVVGIASPSMHGAKRMVVPTENLRELLSWDGSPHEVLEEVETAYRYACLRLKKHNRGPLARGRVRPIPENKDHECQLAQSVIDLVEHANEAAVPDAAVRDYAQPAVTRWIYHVGTAYVALRTLVESDGKIRLAVNFIDPGHTPARQKGTANNQLGANEEHELFRLIVAKAMEDGSSELESRRILLDRLDDPAFRDKEGLRKSTYTMRTLERATEPIRARIRELQQQGMDQ